MSSTLDIYIQGHNEAQGPLQAVRSEVEQTGHAAETSGGSLSQMFEMAGTAAVAFLAIDVFSHITAGVSSIVDAFQKDENAFAQLNQVIKSTGDVSGVTSEGLTDLASSLEDTTKFSKVAVEGAESMLLTFTAIGAKTMPDATTAVLDMAQALGENTKEASIQLGKALQDPIKGVSALQRVGVALTEDEKKQVQAFQDAGDAASAQAIILKELQTEFGGSAEAAGKTFSGSLAILQHHMEDAKAQIGEQFLPQLGTLIATFNSSGALDGIKHMALSLAGELGDAITWVGQTAIPGIIAAWQSIEPAVMVAVNAIKTAVAFLSELGQDAFEWGSALVSQFAGGIAATIGQVEEAVAGIGDVVVSLMEPHSPPPFLPLIDQWGVATAQLYLDAFAQADAGGPISAMGSQLKGALTEVDRDIQLLQDKQQEAKLEKQIKSGALHGDKLAMAELELRKLRLKRQLDGETAAGSMTQDVQGKQQGKQQGKSGGGGQSAEKKAQAEAAKELKTHEAALKAAASEHEKFVLATGTSAEKISHLTEELRNAAPDSQEYWRLKTELAAAEKQHTHELEQATAAAEKKAKAQDLVNKAEFGYQLATSTTAEKIALLRDAVAGTEPASQEHARMQMLLTLAEQKLAKETEAAKKHQEALAKAHDKTAAAAAKHAAHSGALGSAHHAAAGGAAAHHGATSKLAGAHTAAGGAAGAHHAATSKLTGAHKAAAGAAKGHAAVHHTDLQPALTASQGHALLLSQHLGEVTKPLRDISTHITTHLVPSLADLRSHLGRFEPAIHGFTTTLHLLVVEGKRVFDALLLVIKDVLAQIVDYLKRHGEEILDRVMTTWHNVQDTTQRLLHVVAELILAELAVIKRFWDEHGLAVMIQVQTLWDKVWSIINIALELIKATIIPIFQFVAQFLKDHGDLIVTELKAAWDLVYSVIELALDLIQGILQVFLDVAKGNWKGAWEDVKALTGTLLDDLKGIIKAAMDLIGSAIDLTILSIRDAWHRFVAGASGFGNDLIDGIAKGVTGAVGKLTSAVSDAAGHALDAAKKALGIKSPSTVMADEVGRFIPEGIAQGINDHGLKVKDAMGRILDTIHAAEVVKTATQAHSDMTDQVKQAAEQQTVLTGNLTATGDYLQGTLQPLLDRLHEQLVLLLQDFTVWTEFMKTPFMVVMNKVADKIMELKAKTDGLIFSVAEAIGKLGQLTKMSVPGPVELTGGGGGGGGGGSFVQPGSAPGPRDSGQVGRAAAMTKHNEYHLHIHSSAHVEPIVQNFRTMQSWGNDF